MHFHYEKYPVQYWLEQIQEGKIGLPTFQRSFTWSTDRSKKFLQALLDKYPTGSVLILKKNTFELRNFQNGPAPENFVANPASVLDGQQRLTTIWNALARTNDETRFFAQYKDNLETITTKSKCEITTSSTKTRSTPAQDYEKKRVPLDILYHPNEDLLSEWCEEIVKKLDKEPKNVQKLYSSIKNSLNQKLLNEAQIWACELEDELDRSRAAQIFVNINRYAVPVSIFDITIAVLTNSQNDEDEDTRSIIGSLHTNYPDFAEYFTTSKSPLVPEEETYIPQVGEWLFKVGCALNDKPPSDKNYEDALLKAIDESKSPQAILETVRKYAGFGNEALQTVSKLGAVNRKLLPGWPVVHAIAALQPTIREALNKNTKKGKSSLNAQQKIQDLIEAYFWLSVFTERHSGQPNYRLVEDKIDFVPAIQAISQGQDPNLEEIRIFDKKNYPLPDPKEIIDPRSTNFIKFINTANRSSRGIACLLISKTKAQDFFQNIRLDPNKARELDQTRKLERHHIFPKALLKKTKYAKLADSGLNGALITKDANSLYNNEDPKDYLQKTIDEGNVSKEELRARLKTQMLDYDILTSQKPIEDRFMAMLRARAKELCKLIEQITKVS